MPPSKNVIVRLRIDGAKEALRAINQLGPEANKALREASLKLANQLGDQIKAEGSRQNRQARLLAVKTLKVRRDRTPVVVIGGTSAIGRLWPGRGRGRAFELLFGSEFGGRGHGFKPFRREGYWINPTVEAAGPLIAKEWSDAADRVMRSFGTGS